MAKNNNDYLTSIIQSNLGKRFAANNALFKDVGANSLLALQEPHTSKNTIKGIPKSHKAFTTTTSSTRWHTPIQISNFTTISSGKKVH